MSSLREALVAKSRNKNENPTSQFDGVKLAKEHVGELYETLGLEPGSAGAEAFEAMVEIATGQTSPERAEKASADGSKFIGKKLSLSNTDKDTVFTSHVKLCEAMKIPATSSGAQVFRALLTAVLDKTNQ